MADLIYREPLIKAMLEKSFYPAFVRRIIEQAPAVDAVEVEKYNDLREAFVDYVCSGVPNPAPYCRNRYAGCVDSRGWCTYTHCNGFNPDGERKDNEQTD